jgi:hypothetical protein
MPRGCWAALAAVITNAALSSCAVGPGVDPTAHAAYTAARNAYMECAYRKGAALSTDREPAESIARAAIGSCPAEESAAFDAARRDARDDALAMEVIRRLRAGTYEGILALVVQRRAQIR